LKVEVKKLRIVCSKEFVHIKVKEASQKNIKDLNEGTFLHIHIRGFKNGTVLFVS
jgi:hypothetical protein